MFKIEIANAKIRSTFLGKEDHGIFTFYLFIDLSSGGSCGVGGYALDEWNPALKKRIISDKSGELILKILDTVGVSSWEELKGKYIRVEDNGLGQSVYKIGNLMQNKWLDIKNFFKE